MAIIDKQVYKLDNHDIKISNALCRCFEGEKYCNEMLKNLIFYVKKGLRLAVLNLFAWNISTFRPCREHLRELRVRERGCRPRGTRW